MDKVFQKFLRSGIDLSPVGVERRAGRVWTASTSALFETLAVWYFPSVP